MTVKIAKLLTPPPSIVTATLTSTAGSNFYPYDHYSKTTFDTFTMPSYSTATSIMTNRDHPFNHSTQSTQSTRPLLADRKAPQLLGKKKFNNATTRSDVGLGLQRDSGVKVQGINDFDIISEQYKNLHIHHLGYPYGSPPSPTANSSDFVFSDTMSPVAPITPTARAAVDAHGPSSQQPLYDNGSLPSRGYQSNYYCNTSRFEDDFCCRRNDRFDSMQAAPPPPPPLLPPLPLPPLPLPPMNNNDVPAWMGNGQTNGGPFIFGVHHRSPPGGRDFLDSTPVISDRNPTKYSMENGQKSMSNSDTSSSSRDSGKGSKLLVKNRKSSKKNSKEKKSSPTSAISCNNKENRPQIKCVVVGDADVGKTNLIVTYLENRFITEHVPTASDIYNAEVMVNDSPVHVTLCDTAGQDTLDPLRELCYPDSDVFLLCFSVVKPETFHSIKTKWAPKFTKNPASLILVGTQSDLRSNSHVLNKLQTKGEKPISYPDAWDLATSIGAKYIETSSYTQEKVKDVFDTAIWEALAPTTLPPTPPLWKKLFCLV